MLNRTGQVSDFHNPATKPTMWIQQGSVLKGDESIGFAALHEQTQAHCLAIPSLEGLDFVNLLIQQALLQLNRHSAHLQQVAGCEMCQQHVHTSLHVKKTEKWHKWPPNVSKAYLKSKTYLIQKVFVPNNKPFSHSHPPILFIPLGWGDTPWTGPLKLFKVFIFTLENADPQLAYMLVYHISAKIICFPLLAYVTSCKDRCFASVPCWVAVCWNCCVAPVSSHNGSSARPVLLETLRARHMHLQTLASAGRVNMFPDIYGGSWKNDVLVTSNGFCFLLRSLHWNVWVLHLKPSALHPDISLSSRMCACSQPHHYPT